MHMEVSVMAQAASLETAEHGLPGEHGSNKHTVENTYGIPTGSLIWALASHQISRIHWLKGLAPYVPPRLGTGVLEDSTGFARLGTLWRIRRLGTPQADSEQGLSVPLPV